MLIVEEIEYYYYYQVHEKIGTNNNVYDGVVVLTNKIIMYMMVVS